MGYVTESIRLITATQSPLEDFAVAYPISEGSIQ